MIENKLGPNQERFLIQEPRTPGKISMKHENQDVWGTPTPCLTNLCNAPLRPTKQIQSEFSNDLQLLISEEDASVERFIAVPVSPAYLSDRIRTLQRSKVCCQEDQDDSQSLSLVSALVHAPPCEFPPPTSERLSPIGANSRAPSQLSLDTVENETKC